MKYGDQYSELKQIKAEVSRIVYLLYIYDIPASETTTTITFDADTCILANEKTEIRSHEKLQAVLNEVNASTKTWPIKLNETKLIQMNPKEK